MTPHLEPIQRSSQETARIQRTPGHAPSMPELTAEELAVAGEQFRVWVRWYLRKYKEHVRSQAAFARKLDVDPATVTVWLRPGEISLPELRTVWRFARLVGYPIEHVLSEDPPGTGKK
jgi:hypothetical protein